MTDTILVTGGAGFIGSNFIKYLLECDECRIVNLDALTYAGNPENLAAEESNPRYTFIHGSIQDYDLVMRVCKKYDISGIINFAAESHVDRSIMEAKPFIDTNITGTFVLLEAARELGIKRYLQISTDEVYGSIETGKFTEQTPLAPNSPYSASKASADLLVMSYYQTHGLPVLITRSSNNYGPYQFPEKLIPLMILNALENKPLPVYGDGNYIRDWLHVADNCKGLWTAYKDGMPGEIYNIGGNCELTNIELVLKLLAILNKPESLIKFVKNRPGHDRRYAIDSTKIEMQLGWKRKTSFDSGLENTVRWYLENPDWCNNVRTGAYREYYKKQYGEFLFK